MIDIIYGLSRINEIVRLPFFQSSTIPYGVYCEEKREGSVLRGLEKTFFRSKKALTDHVWKKPRFLITPKAFREAGEAYAIMSGMDRETAARRAGHSVEVQKRNYTKYGEIRARDLADKHLLDF